jgi:Thrombospondin type 3 repeat
VSNDGASFSGIQQGGVSPQSINDKGQFVFYARIQRGTASTIAVIQADPLPGVSPGNPIMPALGVPQPTRGWRFVLACNPAALCLRSSPRRYIDPPLAVGYTFQVEAPAPNIASVYIPAPLANGDSTFQVEFNGQSAPLHAGEAFDFTALVPGGVSTFRITGIDTSESLDPTNPAAFVTGLTFNADTTSDVSVTMVPIIVDPDDLDLDGVPNALDLCPNSLEGAVVDANGCSASQRDSDGDGVVDSLDQCPATPLGTPVNANGCSALQLDSDGDGVPNTIDVCPNTAVGAAVNAQGCSAVQRDSDGDGVNDSLDQCPNTPAGAAVNAVGCAASQLDSDHDGVTDNLDQCPNTPAGTVVNAAGCSAAQLDGDGDGVPDSIDLCPGTSAGTAVDANGCPLPVQTKTCDVNGDNFIDYRDIRAVLAAVGKPASGTTDPRDANRNGKIDLIDAAICTSRCGRALCLSPK